VIGYWGDGYFIADSDVKNLRINHPQGAERDIILQFRQHDIMMMGCFGWDFLRRRLFVSIADLKSPDASMTSVLI